MVGTPAIWCIFVIGSDAGMSGVSSTVATMRPS